MAYRFRSEGLACLFVCTLYYEDWEDVARSSFCVMNDLDADCYEMTCAAVVEKIVDLYAEDDTNYAKDIKNKAP